jgi:hypothetical protein
MPRPALHAKQETSSKHPVDAIGGAQETTMGYFHSRAAAARFLFFL